jgi:hypothetical protein
MKPVPLTGTTICRETDCCQPTRNAPKSNASLWISCRTCWTRAAGQSCSRLSGGVLLAAHVRTSHVHDHGGGSPARKSHERFQIVRQPEFEPLRMWRAMSKALGPSWKHAMALEGRRRLGSCPVCGRGAGRTHGGIQSRGFISCSSVSFPWKCRTLRSETVPGPATATLVVIVQPVLRQRQHGKRDCAPQ